MDEGLVSRPERSSGPAFPLAGSVCGWRVGFYRRWMAALCSGQGELRRRRFHAEVPTSSTTDRKIEGIRTSDAGLEGDDERARSERICGMGRVQEE